MNDLDRVFYALMEEGSAARAHFHTWWALRNLALPDHLSTMNNYEYVDFFHISNSGNYNLFFVSLSKIYDRDDRTAGISMLKEELREAGYSDIADEVARRIDPHESLVRKILNIRNKSISHNQADLPRERVYQINGVTPSCLVCVAIPLRFIITQTKQRSSLPVKHDVMCQKLCLLSV